MGGLLGQRDGNAGGGGGGTGGVPEGAPGGAVGAPTPAVGGAAPLAAAPAGAASEGGRPVTPPPRRMGGGSGSGRGLGGEEESKENSEGRFFPLGTVIDVQSGDGTWREAQVCAVSEENRTALLHFRFWPRQNDETLPWDSPRCAPHGTYVFSLHDPLGPRPGHNVDFRPDPFSPWLSGQIIDMREEHEGGDELAGGGGGGGYEEEMEGSSLGGGLGGSLGGGLRGGLGGLGARGAGGARRRIFLVRPHPSPRAGGLEDRWVTSLENLQPFEWRTRAPVHYVQSKTTFWEHRKREPAVQHAAATGAFERLAQGLVAQGLQLQPMGGDGNCLFRSVADQVYGTQEEHGRCRAAAAAYMASESAFFRNYVADDEGGWEVYLANIARDGVWGDDPELQALCEIYGRPAEVWSADNSGQLRRLRVFNSAEAPAAGAEAGGAGASAPAPAPAPAPALPPIRVFFWGAGHYDSLRTGGALTPGWAAPQPGALEHLALASSHMQRSASAPGALETALRDSMAMQEESQLREALQLSRQQFSASAHLNLDLALAQHLQAASEGAAQGGSGSSGGGGGGGGGAAAASAPAAGAAPMEEAAALEAANAAEMAAVIAASQREAEEKGRRKEEEEMQQALAASRADAVAQHQRPSPAAASLPLFNLSTLGVAAGAAAGGGGGASAAAGAAAPDSAPLNEYTVQELIGMGFRDSDVRAALRSSKGDKVEAVARLTGDFFS